MLAQPAKAEDLTWVPSGPQGSGIWDTTTGQWFDGTVTRPWSNLAGDSATFGGPSGTVVLSEPMTIQNLTFLTDGYLLQGAALNFATASSLMTVTTGTASIVSSISGNGTLIKAGAGTLTLSGVNTYTGDTTVNGGTIQVFVDNNLGAANGVLTLNGGTLASAGSFTSARNTILGINDGSIDVASGQILTLSGVISGIGNLTQANTGTLVLTAANTYTGSTSIAGVLQVGNGGATGQLGAGNVVNNGTLTFNLSTAYTYAGLISGSGGLTQNGTGTTVLSGANSYIGNTTINAGKLQVSADNNLGAASGALVLNGGSLVSTATFTSARSVTLNSGVISTAAGTLTLGGQVSGGPLTKTGSGTLVLSSTGNNYVGDTTINGGIVQVASNADLGDVSGNLVFNNGTLVTSAGFSSNRNVLLNSGQGAFTPTTGTLILNGLISGAGQLVMNGAGTLVLANNLNSYSGGTLVSAGTLSIANDTALGASAGALVLQNGTLQTTANLATNRNVAITGVGGLSANAGTTLTVTSQISGSGNLHATGAGTLLLTGNNTYTGGTSLYAGTLQIDSDANLGAAVGGINFFGGMLHTTTNITTNRQVTLSTGGGAFDVDAGTLFVLNGVVGSTGGGFTKIGNGTLVLAADNTYSGQTIINSGTLQVGNGGATGTLGSASITNNGALVFNRSGVLTVSPSISGSGTISLLGSGTTVFSGNNTYTGATDVSAGALYINGAQNAATGLVSVANGATLGGNGTIGGNVILADGATLAPGDVGNAIGTLSLNGNLVLGNGSILNYSFGQAGVSGGLFNDLVSVNGNLTLGGTLNVTQTPSGLFEIGVYRVFNYAGLLTNNTLNIGSLPAGFTGTIQTSVANQVNLIAASTTSMLFWDGGLGAPTQNNHVVDGGSGLWQGSSGNSHWTDANGTANGPWTSNAYAIFEATPGTVTVDNATAGSVSSTGMQFAVDGYHIEGDPLTLVETTPGTATTTVRVGDGTAAGAGYTATIGSVLQGSVLLRKTDLGILVLTGANTYTGGTLVLAGTLQLGDGVTAGSIVGDVSTGAAGTTTGTLAFNPTASTTLSYAGVISGLGSVSQIGNGTTVLTGHNTYTGGTTISAGTLQVGDGTTSGSLVGPIIDNGKLVFNPASGTSSAVASAISGSGQVQQVGLGTTVLTGASTYTGGTLISSGTLQLGDGTTTGSVVGNVVNNGSLSLDPGSALTLNGFISGSGSVHMVGGSTATLTADNTYTGGTFFNGGTLRVTNDNNLGAASGNLVFNGGALNTGSSLTLSRAVLLNGVGIFNVDGGTTLTLVTPIQGSGSLVKTGGGLLDLSGMANTYSGGTKVNGGTLRTSSDSSLGAGSGALYMGGGTLNTTADMTIGRRVTIAPGVAAIFDVDTNTTLTIAGVIDGTYSVEDQLVNGSLSKSGNGSLILTANNTFGYGYTRNVALNAGTLQIGNGGSTGTLGSVDPGIQTSGGTTLVFNRNNALTFSSSIVGAGQVQQIGTGATTLTGNSSYTGGTLISAGQINISGDTNIGATSSALTIGNGTLGTTASFALTHRLAINTAGATLEVANGTTLTADGVIADGDGAGALTKTDTGTLVLNAANTYSGGTTINGGEVQVSADNNLGNVLSALSLNNATLAVSNSFATARAVTLNAGGGTFRVSPGHTFTNNGVITGTGGLIKSDLGTLVLSGDNHYSGSTTVTAGTLFVNGNQSASTGLTTVAAGGTLGGIGTVGGDVVFANGATLAPRQSGGGGGTLTINGNVTVNSGANLNYTFGIVAGQAQDDLVNVGGNLTLGGLLNVSVAPGGTLDPGIYRVFNYSGSFTDNNLAIGSVPTATTLTLQKTILGQINLVNTTGQRLGFWDGSVVTQKNNGSVDGGNGIWNYAVGGVGANDHWTDPNGAVNSTYTTDSFVVFQGLAGTVTVDNSLGQVQTSGLQFLSNGYVISGDPLTLVETANGSGSTAIQVSQGAKATIGSVLQGAVQLRKTDLGTLVLSGANTYTGGTTINGGVLQVANDGNLGAAAGALSLNGGTLSTTASFSSTRATTLNSAGGTFDVAAATTLNLNGVLAGSGALSKTSAGTLVLNGVNTYAGGTVINGGVLQVASDGNLGAAAGALSLSGGTLSTTASFSSTRATTLNSAGGTFDVAAASTLNLNGVLAGSGALSKTSAGTLVLTADNSYGGTTTIAQGTLQLGAGGTTGSLGTGDVVDNATLTFNRSNTYSYDGVISGTGTVQQVGTGTTVLTGTNTYTGGTAINGGVLQVANDGNLGAAAGALSLNGGTLSTTASFSSTRATTLNSAGGTFDVAAATTLNLNGVLAGSGALSKTSAGTLVLNGVNTYAGGTVINGGVLQVASDGNLGAAAGALSLSGGTLSTTASFSSTRATTLNSAGGTFDVAAATTLNLNGVLAGSGALSKTSAGTLVLNGVNTYAGGTVINGGVLQVASDGNLGAAAGALSLSGGTLSTTASFSSTRATTLNSAGGTFDVAAATTLNLNGVLAGSGALSKTSAGTLVLNGVNTYAGGTVINGGVLQVASDGNLGAAAGALSLSGGTLSTTASFSSTRATTLNSAGGTFDVAAATTLNLNGVLAGSGALSKTSAGTLVLNGVNTYAGGTVINGGVLQVASDGNLGAAAGALSLSGGTLSTTASFSSTRATTLNSAGGTFDVAAATTLNLNGVLAGSGALSKTSAGTLVLNGVNTYAGGTVINGGVLQVASDGNLGAAAGALSLSGGTLSTTASFSSTRATTLNSAGGTFDVAAATTLNLNGVLAGSGALSKTSAGTLVLTADNSYGGTTTIAQGTLQLGAGGTTGSLGTGDVVDNATLTFNRSNTYSYDGVISGTGTVQQVGSGTTVLTGTNTYTGGTAINGGVLQVANDGNLGAAAGALSLNGGTLSTTASFSSTRATTLNSAGGTFDVAAATTLNLNGVLAGSGALNKTSAGTLVLNGVNTYAGGTAINGGVLQVASDGNLGAATGALSLDGGTLHATSSLTTSRAVALNTGGGTFEADAGDTLTLQGLLTGSGGLSKDLGGTVVLTADNSYGGTTTITQGSLQLGAGGTTGSLGTGDVLNNATLTVNRSNTYSYGGVISGTGTVQQVGSGTTVLSGSNTYTGGTAINGGVLQVASDSNLGDAAGALSLNGGTLSTTGSFSSTRATTLTGAGGTFDVAAASTLNLNGVLAGSGALNKTSAGTLVLNGANTYAGGTAINGGVLQVASDSNLGDAAGALSLNGGTLSTTGSFSSMRATTLTGAGGTFDVAAATTLNFNGVLSGTGALSKTSAGTLVLNGTNSYSGGTAINGGVLQVASDSNLGAAAGALSLDGGTLSTTASFSSTRATTLTGAGGTVDVATATTLNLNGVLSGTGALSKTSAGTLVLNGTNTYSGGTVINGGVLQVGDATTTGSLGTGDVLNNATLTVNRSNTYSYGGVISGTGTVQQVGSGTTVLSGSNTYSGTTTVTGGALLVNGNQAGAQGLTAVAAGATLGGNGTLGGNLVLASGATLTPGDALSSVGTLTINGDLTINDGVNLAYQLGAANVVGGPMNDLIILAGNLTLDGQLNVTVPTGGAFDVGVYRLFNYGGTLSNNGLTIATAPVSLSNLSLQLSQAHEVNLINSSGQSLSFWDGALAVNRNNATVDGGDGTWNYGPGNNENWTDASGSVNAPFVTDTYAIFQGQAGTVTVDNSLGQIRTTGMQFLSDGYVITGGPVTLLETVAGSGSSAIQVTPGVTASIDAVLQGAVQLRKTNLGTLVLSGANTYTGGTAINGGVLQVASDSNLGDTAGALLLDNGTLRTTASFSTTRATTLNSAGGTFDVAASTTLNLNGVLAGAGSLSKTSAGTLVLNGTNTYTGGTAINGGVLQVASDSNLGDAAGALSLDGGTLSTTASFSSTRATTLTGTGGTFDVAAATTLSLNGVLAGSGTLSKTSAGTLVLTADNSYGGTTTITQGSLQLGAGGTTGSLGTGDVLNNATLAFNRSNTYSYGGVISGTGTVQQVGSGTTVLSGSNTYSGGTAINGGVLQVASDSNLGAAAGGLSLNGATLSTTGSFSSTRTTTLNSAGGTFDVAAATTLNLNGVLAGSGSLSKTSAGTLVLNGTNSYSGGTAINGGVLQVASDSNLGDTAGALLLDNGTLRTTASFSTTRATTLNSAGGTFDVAASTTLNLNGVLAGAGSLSKTSAGTLVLNGTNTYTGGTAINGGVLQVASDSNLGDAAGALSLDGGTLSTTASFSSTRATTLTGTGGTFDVAAATTLSLNGVLAGSGTLSKTSAGTLVLTADNSYGGTTTITQGSLQLGAGGTTGSLGTGDVLDNATLAFNRSNTYSYGGVISGTGTVQQVGSGTTVLSGSNTYSGGTAINGGVLQVASDSNLGAAAGGLSLNGATLSTTGSFSSTRTTTLNSAGGTFDVAAATTLNLNGVLAGSGSLSKTSAGTLVLNGTNSYSGGTAINGGVLQVASDSNLGDTAGALLLDNGTLSTTGSFSSTRATTLNSAGGTFDVAAASTLNLNGVLAGSGALSKTSAGTLVLNAANTYTGGTTINGGVLQVASDSNLGAAAGALSLDGGTLSTTGSFSSTRATTLNSAGGTFDVAAATTLNLNGVIAGSGALNKTSAGTLVLNGANTYAGGTVINGGVLQVASDGNLGAAVGTLSLDGGTLSTTGSFSSTRATTLNSAGGTFDVAAATTLNQNGVLAGSGALSKISAGTLVLTADNSYGGTTTIAQGILQLGTGGTTGSLGTGDVIDNATLVFNRSNTYSYGGVISGTGTVQQVGSGTTVLSGSNTYSGGTAINGGVLQVASDGNLGAAVGTLSLDGGTLSTTGSFSSTRATTLAGTGGTFDVAAATTLNLNGVLAGSGLLSKTNAGTLVLTADNSYGGITTIAQGTLQLGAGGSTGSLGTGDVIDNATLAFNRSNTYNYGGVISGTGTVQQAGSGTTVLSGSNTYSGGTAINGGVLQVASNSNLGDAAGALSLDGGTLSATASFSSTRATTLNGAGGTFDVAAATTLNLNGVIAGSGALSKTSAGTLVLNAANTYTGGTAINGGVLQVGDATTAGSLGAGDVLDNATLTFNRSNTYSYGGVISGTGTVQQVGSGTTVLSGSNTYSGTTTVTGGSLFVNGNQAGAQGLTTVAAGATLGGNGTLGGSMVLASGATLTPGDAVASVGTLTINGDLTINDGVNLAYQLGAANVVGGPMNDLVTLGGNLTLGGELNVTVPTGGTFDVGVYRLFNYGGTLSNNGLTIATTPVSLSNLSLQLSQAHEVNLINSSGQTLSFWDGSLASSRNNATVDGGDGTWNYGPGNNENWTDASGSVNAPFVTDTYAIFQGQAGTVTVDNSLGQIRTTGMQFLSDGYVITGGPVTLLETVAGSGSSAIQVTPGVTASIDAVLQGAVQLRKTNLGTLVLSGANTYTGGTAINGGVLQVASDSNLGDTAGGLFFNGGTLQTSSSFATQRQVSLNAGGAVGIDAGNTLTLGGGITGTGSLIKTLAGTLVLTADNTYTGGTAINGGVLQVASDSNLGDAAGALSLSGGTLKSTASFSTTRAITLNGAASTFSLAAVSPQATTLTGAGGTFDVAAATTLNLNGVLAGSGALNKTSAGTLVLNGVNTYSGGTAINGGVLQVASDSNLGDAAGGLSLDGGTLHATNSLTTTRTVALNAGGGTFEADAGDTLTLQGLLTGSGALNKDLGGTVVLTADNSYGGTTTITQGSLQLGAGGTTGSLGTGDVLNNATLVFNRSNTYSYGGVISGTGTVQQMGSGTTLLSGLNTYHGKTTVSAGRLQAGATNALSNASDYTIAQGAVLDTAGFNQTLASLDNSGTVSLAGAAPGTTLIVQGAYVGRDGVVQLSTVLGDSGSVTDRLVLNGAQASTMGHTTLSITNKGGLGALTRGDGIVVVSAQNGATTTAQTTKDAFTLVNGHVDAGAYQYRLYAADAKGAGEDWFLRSTTDGGTGPSQPSKPTYRADVPVYAALPGVIRQSDLAMLSTLHGRVGDQSTGTTVGAESGNRVWTRAINNRSSIEQKGTTSPHSNTSAQGMQVGIDLWSNGDWSAGLYAGQLRLDSDVKGQYGLGGSAQAGSLKSDSEYLGGYASYVNQKNQYGDFVLQYGHHDMSDKAGSGTHHSVGNSVTASAEVGQRFALNTGWGDLAVEPQAQLIVNQQNLGNTRISGHTTVAQSRNTTVVGRVGLRLTSAFNTDLGRLEPYVRVDLWHGFDATDTTRFKTPAAGTTAIHNGIGYTSTEVSTGFTLALNKSTSVYAEVGDILGSGTGQAKVGSTLQSSVGIKVSW
ncbi:autotransporter-associated beta strand repeat-containing protein [Pseudomonas chlororaphis]|uniref:autotransporter-associated beta strand repeat-containing protein n=1 Tax=Pseudomonas chlororaphis TaxID=587753 RepID=UPI001F4C47E3|nr:autotransporter-associated beta strand repeat-containing protein [Pseudomonas chlororaphis]